VRCGGQFVGNEELSVLIARHQATLHEGPKRLVPRNPLSEKVTYLPCPICQELMLRRNFGRASGIIVDVCSLHGTWFDIGELARILSFVGQGGLQKTRSMEATERKWLSEQSRTLTLTANHSAMQQSSVTSASSITLSDMEEATRAFVRWLQDLIS
jgi:Zn-finger nucleic acid-binding protein